MSTEIRAVGRAAPKGVARLRTYAKGREILVVGPSSAGKSKFAQYLRLGTLAAPAARICEKVKTGNLPAAAADLDVLSAAFEALETTLLQ